MSKRIGLSFNRNQYLGRVEGAPTFPQGWARLTLVTLVPQNTGQGWEDVEHRVPLMTDNPKTIETIQKYVENERQLYVEGYTTSWADQNGGVMCGIMITNLKLGSKTMYDPDANQGGGQGGGNMPGFPPGN